MVRHNRFLSEQNTTDPLTGLFNRNGFRQAILPTAMAAHRNDFTVGIMMISVDNLQELYASLGCEEGDQAVKDLAELLRESVRLSDVLGRHSFSVFYVFFPKVRQQFLHTMASRIIQNIEIRAPWVPRATLSIGASYAPLKGDAEQALERLFEKASDCLHRARLSRTNRVVIE
jgi:diguanylate cyclase (GGDEF)-like protein